MMHVVLQRAWSDHRATLGMLKILNVNHNPLFTLENPERNTTKDSRIPEGNYLCIPYSGYKYKDVYLIKGVPDRTAILFHWGNFEKDTEGCVLLGLGAGTAETERPYISESKLAMAYFRSLIGPSDFILKIVGEINYL